MELEVHPDFLKAVSVRERLLVGCSGGRDSVALAMALKEAGYEGLILGHVNYGLRGEDSEKDELFVKELGNELGLEVVVERAEESPERGIELWARELRMDFFRRFVRGRDLSGVALGHHADDQAETVLFNLCRGGGGIRGMRVVSELQELKLYRPLLEWRREEVTRFLERRGQTWREDASNAERGEAAFSRNRMRNEVLPLLREVMRREVVPLVGRTARLAMEEDEAMDELLEGMDLKDPQRRLFLPKVAELAEALQRRVIMNFLKEHKVADLNELILERAIDLLRDEQVAKVNLPGGRYLRRKEKRLFVDG